MDPIKLDELLMTITVLRDDIKVIQSYALLAEGNLNRISTALALFAKIPAAAKEVPMESRPADTESPLPTTDESVPPPSPSPSEPSYALRELESSMFRIAAAVSVRQGTPLPGKYCVTPELTYSAPVITKQGNSA